MLADIYKETLDILFTIGGVTILLILANMLFQWSLSYIRDEDYKANDYITKRFLAVCPIIDNDEKRWIHEHGDIGWTFPAFFLNTFILALIILVWPIATVASIIFGTLWSLRSGNRIRKNVGKLNKVAHDHNGEEILRFKN